MTYLKKWENKMKTIWYPKPKWRKNKQASPDQKKSKATKKNKMQRKTVGKQILMLSMWKARVVPAPQQEHLQDVCNRISKNLASFSFEERSSKFWPVVPESEQAQKLQNYLKSRSSLLTTCDNPCRFETPSLILCCTQYRGFAWSRDRNKTQLVTGKQFFYSILNQMWFYFWKHLVTFLAYTRMWNYSYSCHLRIRMVHRSNCLLWTINFMNKLKFFIAMNPTHFGH